MLATVKHVAYPLSKIEDLIHEETSRRYTFLTLRPHKKLCPSLGAVPTLTSIETVVGERAGSSEPGIPRSPREIHVSSLSISLTT